jgi:predicted phage tail component-like protein
MNYIIWDDNDSRNIKGLLISELPTITKPNLRVRETFIDGVDGSIIEELGYESYDKTIIIALKNGADIDEIIGYFTGFGGTLFTENRDVVFSNEPDKYYRAKIVKSINYERLLRYRVAKVTFRVQPFKYRREATCKWTNSGGSGANEMIVTNNGNYTSKPCIFITGSGTIKLSVNFATFQYTFPSGENYVCIDCEAQEATGYVINGTNLRNRHMVGDFPTLAVGENDIYLYGAIESIEISNYSRWL